jgi:DNA-binding MarR family transcriptional regulator
MRANHFEVFSTSIAQLIKAMQFLKSRKMAQYGLKGTTALCLCQILDSEGGLTAGELAELGEIDKAQVSRSMAELSEKGFVTRGDEENRRYKLKYQLTPKGRAAAEDITAAVRRVQDTVSKDISDADLNIFYSTLYKLCENFAALLEEEDV